MNILVTVKNEYMIRIKNLLTKIIFDGLNSIYTKTREVSNNDDFLKVFQSLLKRVPKWTDEILNNEVMRVRGILDLDNNFELLNNLIKASIKATYNIMIFGSEIDFDINNLLSEFNFKDFIRNIYIESSREIYNNPFLFYHLYTPVEIKRNQREVLNIIGNAIEESVRRLLPIKIILDSYLNRNNKTFKVVYPNEILDHNDGVTLMDNYVQDDINNNIFAINKQSPLPFPSSPKQQTNNQPINNQIANPIIPTNSVNRISPNNLNNNISQMRGGNDSSVKILNSEVKLSGSSDENSVQNKILDIINEKSLDLSKQTNISEFENTNSNNDRQTGGNSVTNNNTDSANTNSIDETFMTKEENHSSINNSSVKKINNDLSNNNHSNSNNNSVSNSNNNSNDNTRDVFQSASNKMNQINKSQSELDSKLEKLLKNDLGDSDTDSTLVVDNQSNYQEVFSNSNSSHDSSLNSQQKNDEINKSKFFANYLNTY
tara:strand:+ start:166 stop:1626 length:1461 start_codon:yes stop_codon:yes gene_type:complete